MLQKNVGLKYFGCMHCFSFIAECEKLIRRMLQLEPAKRIPLNKVLEHRWMQGMELDLQPTSKMRVFGSNEHIFWNSHVLAAIQKMNYDVDRCKQVRKSLNVFRFPIISLLCQCSACLSAHFTCLMFPRP